MPRRKGAAVSDQSATQAGGLGRGGLMCKGGVHRGVGRTQGRALVFDEVLFPVGC